MINSNKETYILELADNMAAAATNIRGQGYEVFIRSRETLIDAIREMVEKKEIGNTPVLVINLTSNSLHGGIGRHNRLKICRSYGRAGSIPAAGTIPFIVKTMSTTPLVTVITATIGTEYLKQAVESVNNQTYPNIQHLIVIDGKEHVSKVEKSTDSGDTLILPYNTGADGFNGHRIYGAANYIAKGDYICYLDEDNWYQPNHIEELVKVATPNSWSYSFRRIMNGAGEFICNDDCESLGLWPSILNDHFVDVNCYFFPKNMAVFFSPLWYRRARKDVPEVDRLLCQTLMQKKFPVTISKNYSVNYRAGSTENSVNTFFFLNGNADMVKKHGIILPWRM
jgi:hypothetical protein